MSPSFTTLPLEIRNQIYSHVFDFDRIRPFAGNLRKRLLFHSLPKPSEDFYLKNDAQHILALLFVNHQSSDEAASYFYGKTRFCGCWREVADFVKGIGARRRNLVRDVEISHPSWLAFVFKKNESFKLLGGLANLRTVRITASVPDFTHLKNEFIQGRILELAGKVDISVYNFCGVKKLSDSTPPGQYYKDSYLWSCAKDTTQWTGGERIRTLTAQYSEEHHHWVLE
ncbi:MAG: hypothetical protein ALECFALPRED_005359 [Alectoria fallacina]|uniref:2EXR domain-containing protein n=1 Tax=Alectoria fallacina TaxID=1903189 RepID=A0A8H3G3X8_9LECA|nr:MAG: hypothetical protein ALECFALPRED_005359 [Alectoria fallacina]